MLRPEDMTCQYSYQHAPGETCKHCRLQCGLIESAQHVSQQELAEGREMISSFHADNVDCEFDHAEMNTLMVLAAIGLLYCEGAR